MHVPPTMWFSGIFSWARTIFVTNSRFRHRAATCDSLGTTCLTRDLGDNEPGLVRIDPPPSARPPPARNVWLGVNKDVRNTSRIRAFTTALFDGIYSLASRMNPTVD